MYHRKYLDMYSFDLPQAARDVVDEVQNCDDILFNYMIANATQSGPAGLSLPLLPPSCPDLPSGHVSSDPHLGQDDHRSWE